MGLSISYQFAVDTIYHWDSNQNEQKLIFDQGPDEITRYMEAVEQIQKSRANGIESDDLKSKAMARLKREFHTVLARQIHNSIGLNSTSGWSSTTDSTDNEDYKVYDLPNKVIEYLRNVAERMNSGGKLGDCVRVYKSKRKYLLDTVLKRLRVMELSKGQVAKRFPWDYLKMKIELWIRVAKLCFYKLFDSEKQICGQIFKGFGVDSSEECFVEIVKDSVNNLLIFAKALSLSNQPSERMGTILDLYDTFVSLLPKIDALFDSKSAETIRTGVQGIVFQLEKDVKRMLSDFEKAVFNELSPIQEDRGAIHPLTVKVIDYIHLTLSHKKLLTNLINSMPPLKFGDQMISEGELGDLNCRSHFELHLILIIVVLQLNLKGKSEQYEHVPLRHLFRMNNVFYLVQKIQGSQELREMIGNDYMVKLNSNVRDAMTSYQVSTCYKFLSCFREEGLYVSRCFCSQVSKCALRKQLKTFNFVFEEIQKFHSNWIVHDLQLRDELRVSMVDKLIPPYKEFLHKFRTYIEIEKNSKIQTKLFRKINVKHSVEDLEALISKHLFSYTEISA